MTEFKLPSLGADMKSATFVEWMVESGESVRRGQSVAAVETTKGILELEAYEEGRFSELLAEPGKEFLVGDVLATFLPEAEKEAVDAPVKPLGRQKISPAARRRAVERGINVDALAGSGPEGAVTLADVEAATQTAAEKPAAPEAENGDIRSVIAAAMSRSKREIPHYYLSTGIDFSAGSQWLSDYNATQPVCSRMVYGVVLLRAVTRALDKYPEFSGHYRNDRFEPATEHRPGMAISLRQGGLVAPAMRDVCQQDWPQLMASFLDLVNRTRAGRLKHSEYMDATLTITSLGEQGVERVFPIIYPPQVAIVGFGSLVQRPWSVDGKIESRPVIEVSLAADHRVTDGHRGALFLHYINHLLQDPQTL